MEDEYFTCGFMPRTLSPSCCTSMPKFPAQYKGSNRSAAYSFSPVHLSRLFSPCLPSWLFSPHLPTWLFHPVHLPGSFTLSTFLALFTPSTFLALSPVHLPGFFHPAHLPGYLLQYAESACCSVIPFVGYCSVSICISVFCCVWHCEPDSFSFFYFAF